MLSDMFGDGGAGPFSTHRALGDISKRFSASSIASAGVKTSAWVQARAVAARTAQTGERLAATHLSLDSLLVHRLEPGHYVAPLICSGSTSLPFAVGLELFSSTCQEEAGNLPDVAMPECPGSEGLLSLQYILDGRAQVDGLAGEPLSAQAGDTLLSRSSSGTLSSHSSATGSPNLKHQSQQDGSRLTPRQDPEQAESSMSSSEVATSGQPPLCMDAELHWDAAILTVMVDGHAGAAADEQGSATLQRMTSAWQDAPVTGTLSQKVVAGIIERAQTAARTALSDNRPAQSPGSSDSRPDLFAQLQSSLRGLRLDAPPAQQDDGQAGSQSASAMPAAVQNLPSDALQYIMSGALGRWFRQHSPAENWNVLDRLRAQQPSQAEDTGAALKRGLQEVAAFRLPNQTNRLALIMDPLTDQVPFTFGIEIFEKGHKTTPHTHPTSQELFFILAGQGEGFCGDERFPVSAGDVVVFPPQSVHGIDVSEDARMYCLELMHPNDMFAEFVKSGQLLGGLADDDLCILAALGCGGGKT